MRKVIYSMFGLAVLLFASSCEKPIEQPDPTLTLSQTEVPVPADGGTYSVAYKVTNPRDGAKVSVEAATNDWVTEFEVTGNNINFVVAANEALEQRSVDVTVSYPGATEQVFTIVQSARGLDYDYTLIGSYWSFYEAYGINGEDNYYVAFSDKPITGGYLENGSVAYILDFYVEGGSTSGRELPEGIYTLGAAGETTPMSVGADESYFTLISEDGTQGTQLHFTEGSVEVSVSGDTYTIEGLLTDTEGQIHHFVYNGPGFPALPESIEVDATLATASCVATSGGLMEVAVQLTDMTPDAEGNLFAPGSLLTLDIFMPYDEEGKVATGTYGISDSMEEFTAYPGMDVFGIYTLGTYIQYAPDEASGFSTYLISEGTIDISGDAASGYTVDCNFVTEEGIPVSCTYEGVLEIAMPGPNSTLEGDYEANLDGASAEAAYYADYYGTGGGNWLISIMPAAGGDGLQLDLVCDGLDFTDGIPSGTYTASTNPGPREYLAGYVDGNYLTGTWYLDLDASGNLAGYAPAVEGDIEVVNNGDGTYSITFACTDDAGYVWSGSWSGEMALNDATVGYNSVGASSGRSYMAAPAEVAQTVVQKAEAVKANGFKLAKVQKVPYSERFAR